MNAALTLFRDNVRRFIEAGYGFMREYGVSRAFVDARVQRIYGGTSEIMKELISRCLLA